MGLLKEVANKNNAKIVRSLLTDDKDSGNEVAKFIYLSGESNYFDNFKNIKGKSFKTVQGKIQDSESFISSKDTRDKNQIGKINTHMHNLNITLRTLNQQINYFKTSGLYFVEFPNGGSKTKFLKELKQGLEKEFHIELEKKILKQKIAMWDFHIQI